MFRKSKYLIGLMAMILLLALPVTAFGAYAYDYADNEFIYSTAGLSFANNTWYLLGLTYNSNYGSLFTKFRVLGGMPYGNAFYCYSHGNVGGIADNYGTWISAASISTARAGDWKKFVYADSCYGAYNGTLASGFGIRTGDGSYHAFLGWKGLSYDSYPYYRFNYYFWRYVRSHYTVGSAAYYASVNSGIFNYRFYGAPYSTRW